MSVSNFEYIKDALRYKSIGNYALAEIALNRALSLDPNSISTLSELALLKMDQHLYTEAIQIYNTINETKVLPITLYRRAYCLYKLGKEAEALNSLTDLELMQYDFPGSWELRSDIYMQHNETKEALECINVEIKASPNNLILYHKRAKIYIARNKPELAIQDYKKICLADYKNIDSYIPYIEILIEYGNYVEANTYLKQSLMYGTNERLTELNNLVCEKLGLHFDKSL